MHYNHYGDAGQAATAFGWGIYYRSCHGTFSHLKLNGFPDDTFLFNARMLDPYREFQNIDDALKALEKTTDGNIANKRHSHNQLLGGESRNLGKDDLSNLLTQFFKVACSILDNDVIFVGRVRLSFCDYGMRLVGRNRETWVQVSVARVGGYQVRWAILSAMSSTCA